jgi:hypothetical protein
MLYSFDGASIKRVAAKLMYWPEELRARYSEIRVLEKKPKAALRPWGSSETMFGGRRMLRGVPTRSPTDRGGTQPTTMDEYMLQYMQMQRGQQ